MSRITQICETFDRCGTDKGSHHGYSSVYAQVPVDIKTIFEVGIASGGSIASWLELFPDAHIYAIDILAAPFSPHPRITTYHQDIMKFDASRLPHFDLVIDDGSHSVGDVLIAWEKLWPLCDGTYIIEDVISPELVPALAKSIEAIQRPGMWRIEVINTGNKNADDRVIRVQC